MFDDDTRITPLLVFFQDIPLRVVDNTSHKKNQATDDVVALDSNPMVASEEVKWPDIALQW